MSNARSVARSAGAAMLLLLLQVGPAAAAAARFASLNVCADQLLLMLADREEIASLSYHGPNPNFSYYWERARGLPFQVAKHHARGEAWAQPLRQPLYETAAVARRPGRPHRLRRRHADGPTHG